MVASDPRPGARGVERVAPEHGVVIRSATVDDVAVLVALLRAGTLGMREDDTDLTAYEDALREITASTHGDVLVAQLAGRVVGFCQLIIFRHLQACGGLCAEIESLHVDEPSRSGGIGGALLEAAVARASAAGCYRVQLTSNTQRTRAHRFYLRHGFAQSHEGFKRHLR